MTGLIITIVVIAVSVAVTWCICSTNSNTSNGNQTDATSVNRRPDKNEQRQVPWFTLPMIGMDVVIENTVSTTKR